MKKQEFLDELRTRLAGLSKDDLENRIGFYDEMISDRMDEGKSEEEAVAEIGSVDSVVGQIADETPLLKIVTEKAKPKRSLRGWEIALIILGFPLWLPLLITGFVLCLVAYLLIWVLVIVTYAVEIAFVASAGLGLASFFAYLYDAGTINLMPLGMSLLGIGGAFLCVLACIGATKLTIQLSKRIIRGIKKSFLRKGNK